MVEDAAFDMTNVVWHPHYLRFLEAIDFAGDYEEDEDIRRSVAEWKASIIEQPHIQRLLAEVRALDPDEFRLVMEALFGPEDVFKPYPQLLPPPSAG